MQVSLNHEAAGGAAPDAAEARLLAPLLALMSQSQQGFALFDEHDRLQWANPVFREILGLRPDEFPSWPDLMRLGWMREKGTQVVTDDFEHWLRSAQLRRGKLPFRTIETSLMDGRWVMTTETTAPNGWMLCVISDISELGRDWRVLRQERDQARKAAFSDELTGLSNRRYLLENLRRKLGPHKASAAAVVLLDLDHFKQVNDVHGHEVGDVVLKHFAGLLQAEVGRQELAGRLGGEEFLLVWDIGDTSLLRARVDRLLERVRQSSPAYQGGVLRYTCSAGVAQALPGESEAQLIRRADAALYQAKQQGRDRWVLADATAVMPERRGSRSQRATPD